MDNKKLIEDFYKECGTTKFPKQIKLNGKCHIGNKNNCKYYAVKDNKEVCLKGQCLTR